MFHRIDAAGKAAVAIVAGSLCLDWGWPTFRDLPGVVNRPTKAVDDWHPGGIRQGDSLVTFITISDQGVLWEVS